MQFISYNGANSFSASVWLLDVLSDHIFDFTKQMLKELVSSSVILLYIEF